MSYKKYRDLMSEEEKQLEEQSKMGPPPPSPLLIIKTLEEKKHLVERNKVCVVDVWKSGCPPCKMLAPKFNQLALKYAAPGNCAFISEDVNLGISPSVKAAPTVQFFFKGRLVHVITGPDVEAIERKINELLTQR